MSASVRVKRRGSGRRLISIGVGILLTSGASVAALLCVTSMAAGGLVAAAAHRPGALADWRAPAMPAKAPAPTLKTASLFAEHDAAFGRAAPKLGERLAALGDRLVEARAADEPESEAVRVASLQPASKPGAHDAMRLAASLRTVEVAPAPRVVTPQPPVQASVVPEAPVMRLAALEPQAPAPVALAPVAVNVAVAEPVFVPVPRSRPFDLPRMAARSPEALERPEAAPPAPGPRPTALAYATPELETRNDGPNDFFRGLLGQAPAIPLPGARRGIAIYDIATATVRLPNGEMLEAHSGLGHRQDNAAYVREKNRGPTPPNVYDLRMREALFHGTEAIRLTPRDQKRVFNRDGLLAHSYMYAGGGPRSQSNGCVVFKNYGRFLRAFKAGEIAKLVVVPNMAALPTYMAGL